ncbi:uncharacterized protein LOC107664062 [Sinocyclocheilus anshuiensis]|uniref:uncharacterized protein LOC107664062 n=1 Tax=Sinocyclocheilus anshuiensis TaxID=1608454 RepID=UPI0007B818A1|nr:PREDICTED: uncharacterized protein LOC107664062 [Sinocyclocheilus anshuiensis]
MPFTTTRPEICQPPVQAALQCCNSAANPLLDVLSNDTILRTKGIHLVVIKCEYKAEMKCAWTTESSRMKSSVQLGLLCLSLLISSLHGEEEVETDSSMHIPIKFDEPDLHQFEMYRVRRQTVSTEKENTAKTVAVVPPSENSKTKRKRPRPGGLTPLGDSGDPTSQDKNRNNKQKKRPGSQSLLAISGVFQLPQQTAKAKRDAGGKRPLPES